METKYHYDRRHIISVLLIGGDGGGSGYRKILSKTTSKL